MSLTKRSEGILALAPVVYNLYKKPNRKNLRVKARFYYASQAKGFKFEFLAFKTIEQAREYVMKVDSSGYKDVADGLGYFLSIREPGNPDLIGVIVTGGEWVKDGIIVHECSHAVFHWFERMGKDIDEELFCTILGRISAAILRICLDSYSADELLPS